MSDGKTSVLVIEDDAAVRDLIVTALRSHGYQVFTAAEGEEALRVIAHAQPDIVLLDLGLPDIDGVVVINKVRMWSKVPIIVVSARTEDSDKIGALDAGADDYLSKPFSVGELLARIRTSERHLSYVAEDEPRSSVFENGDLRIDYVANIAWVGDRELRLTPMEYKLLCLLARNVDRVLTHQYILREVWGGTQESDLASLRVFMATLRKKIEDDPARPRYIQTRVGVGYRMLRL